MAKECEITNRKAMVGNKRSKALNATKRKWDLNLQTVVVEVDGKKQKLKMSTKAIKTMKKEEKAKSKSTNDSVNKVVEDKKN